MQANLIASHLIKEIIRKQGWIDLPAEGTSMYPLIKKGNICRFISCEAIKLNKGDIILFQTSSGSLVAHRFLSTAWKDQQVKYLLKGDTNLGLDKAIHYDQIIGKLTSIKKAKYRLRLPSLSVNIWSQMILQFPIISVLLRSYLNRRLNRRE